MALIRNDLQLKYKPLVGMNFTGTYKGEYTMPQTGNQRDILVIEKQNPFAAILQGISDAVRQTYGNQIWKGITGPGDRADFGDYWLWVEPVEELTMEGLFHNFRIEQCTPFPIPGIGNQFSYGVSIKVSVIQPA